MCRNYPQGAGRAEFAENALALKQRAHRSRKSTRCFFITCELAGVEMKVLQPTQATQLLGNGSRTKDAAGDITTGSLFENHFISEELEWTPTSWRPLPGPEAQALFTYSPLLHWQDSSCDLIAIPVVLHDSPLSWLLFSSSLFSARRFPSSGGMEPAGNNWKRENNRERLDETYSLALASIHGVHRTHQKLCCLPLLKS